MVIFTVPAPTPIQSSVCNVHYKDEAWKPLCKSYHNIFSKNIMKHLVMASQIKKDLKRTR